MNPQLIKYLEIGFDLFYLLFIWLIVYKMYSSKNKDIGTIGNQFKLSFLLLALGDTGHVGFRVWAYSLGDITSRISIFNTEIMIKGVGTLMTAYTITIFYMLLINIWHERFGKKNPILYYILQGIAVFRLIIMAFPQNQWNNITMSYTWSMYRNIPLLIIGFVLVVLMIKDAVKNKDIIFKKLGIYIIISYLFYMPVIFWVRDIPMLGMLMMPKTIAYLFMAILVYKTYFKNNHDSLKENNRQE